MGCTDSAVAPAEREAFAQRIAESASHWSDSVEPSGSQSEESPTDRSLSWALWQLLIAAKAEKWVFEKIGARYVVGTEPWLELQRALGLQKAEQEGDEAALVSANGPRWNTKLGSAYRLL